MVNIFLQTIDVSACVGTESLLGSTLGEAHLPQLMAAVFRAKPGEVVFFDFTAVQVMTASYVAAAVLPILRMVTAGSLGRFLVFGNFQQMPLEELALVLGHEKLPILVGAPGSDLTVLGPLDQAYRETFQEVMRRGSVTARDLLEGSLSPSIGLTGWIKRLTTLHALGLIQRTKLGREFEYEPVVLEVDHG